MRESDLLHAIYRAQTGLPSRVRIGPGDDMAVIRSVDGELLVAVDQVADGVHFRLAEAGLDRVGRKSITRNLSDVAAMGGRPLACTASTMLPRSFHTRQAERLFEAMRRVAADYEAPLVGGDIGIWDGPLQLSVTVLAESAGVEPVRRIGVAAGDRLFVTGSLGGSMEAVAGSVHHLDFEPRLAAGRALAASATLRPRAMIDLSDGLGADLPRMLGDDHTATVELDRLPLSEACLQAARRSGRPAWRHAIGDGEDYELLLAAPAEVEMPREMAGVLLTPIGVVKARVHGDRPVTWIDDAGDAVDMEEVLGWDHGRDDSEGGADAGSQSGDASP